jgi:hypothetical protein
MKNVFIFIIFCLTANTALVEIYPQIDKSSNNSHNTISDPNKILYSSLPNHRELAAKTLELAFNSGFIDTLGIGYQKIEDRLEAGSYSEDFESIPGTVGEHFPTPWNQGPSYNFNGLYPFSKIPYGDYLNNFSGWKRGFYHGYDPVQGFTWPGADLTTVEWANSDRNNFTWDNAVNFYKNEQKEKAYECLGHLLHLLEDLSIPSHVKVINHGIGIGSIKSGTVIAPDVLVLITDEYEMALSGGISIPTVIDFIPNLLNNFRSSLQLADKTNIPDLENWNDYFTELATYTYNHPIVKKYYSAPVQNGKWGSALNVNGNIADPEEFGITPPSQITGRWAQISIKSTASLSGSVLPSSDMVNLSNDLVPKAVEYGAGLLKNFFKVVTSNNEKKQIPSEYNLIQNYPNPFNPITTINYSIEKEGNVILSVYDVIGNRAATIVDEYKPKGSYSAQFNGNKLASGIYIYQLKVNDFVSSKTMVLLK